MAALVAARRSSRTLILAPIPTAENNLFLVRRLVQRTDMRNPDPGPSRFTSLAWAAVLACEEVFEFLLGAEHDEEELSRVSHRSSKCGLRSAAAAGPYRGSSYAID